MTSVVVTYDPWGTPMLAVWDTVRLVCIVVGAALVVGLIRLITATRLQGRMLTCGGFLCLAISSIGTEIQAIGTPATYRLATNCLGILVALYGVIIALRSQEP